jgi:PHD/YefM family antitoxin component YafN of YafNO toxin-antitoxin module
MLTVTSAELQKQFGRFRDLARREPVSVTHHGRDSLVILAADEYERLKALDTRKALHPWELPNDLVEALDRSAPPDSSAQFDHELS